MQQLSQLPQEPQEPQLPQQPQLSQEPPRSNLFFAFSVVFLAIIAFLQVAGWVFYFWPYAAVEIQNVEILTPKVIAGENVRWRVQYCKYTDAVGETYRQLVDSDNLIWLSATAYGTYFQGCGSTVLTMAIPISALSGEYRIDSSTEYLLWGSKRFTLHYQTQPFEVIQPEILVDPPTKLELSPPLS